MTRWTEADPGPLRLDYAGSATSDTAMTGQLDVAGAEGAFTASKD